MLFVGGIIGCGLIGLYCTYQQESVETRVKKWSFFSSNRQSRGWRLRPFPGMLLCPLNIPKITIFHGIGCSLHLNIEHLFVLLCFWEHGQRLEYGQAIDPQNLPLSGYAPSAVTKYLNFLVWSGDGESVIAKIVFRKLKFGDCISLKR